MDQFSLIQVKFISLLLCTGVQLGRFSLQDPDIFLMLVDALDMDMPSAKDQKMTLLELKMELM